MLFVPVWFGIYFNMFFLVGAAIWLFVLPMALHQIWQPADVNHDTAWPILRPESAQPILRPESAQPILRPYPTDSDAPEPAPLAAAS